MATRSHEELAASVEALISQHRDKDLRDVFGADQIEAAQMAQRGERLIGELDMLKARIDARITQTEREIALEERRRSEITQMRRNQMQRDADALAAHSQRQGGAADEALEAALKAVAELRHEKQQLQLEDVASAAMGGLDAEGVEREFSLSLFEALGIDPQRSLANCRDENEVWEALRILSEENGLEPTSVFEKYPSLAPRIEIEDA